MGEVGVGVWKIIEEFLKTGEVRNCKILLLKLIWECKMLSKEDVMSPSNY